MWSIPQRFWVRFARRGAIQIFLLLPLPLYLIRALGPELIPVSRQSLLSVRPAVTFPAEERHRPLASTTLHCLVTEAHVCEQLVRCRYVKVKRPGVEPRDLLTASPMPWLLSRVYTWYIYIYIARIQVARPGYLYPATCIWCKRVFTPPRPDFSGCVENLNA